jgi:hypothetical protein
MTPIEEIVSKYYDLKNKPLDKIYINEGLSGIELIEIMKKYAEWYAKECIEQTFGGKCTIDRDSISWVSNDKTVKYITSCPNTVLENG